MSENPSGSDVLDQLIARMAPEQRADLKSSLERRIKDRLAYAITGVCPRKDDHHGPDGPNEDIGMCICGLPIGVLRPVGQTFGHHLPDCSLPVRHRGPCVGGGDGHPPADTIRG